MSSFHDLRSLYAFLRAQYTKAAPDVRVQGLLKMLDAYGRWLDVYTDSRVALQIKRARYWLMEMDPVLRGLAAEFVDQPGFRSEWKLDLGDRADD